MEGGINIHFLSQTQNFMEITGKLYFPCPSFSRQCLEDLTTLQTKWGGF